MGTKVWIYLLPDTYYETIFLKSEEIPVIRH